MNCFEHVVLLAIHYGGLLLGVGAPQEKDDSAATLVADHLDDPIRYLLPTLILWFETSMLKELIQPVIHIDY